MTSSPLAPAIHGRTLRIRPGLAEGFPCPTSPDEVPLPLEQAERLGGGGPSLRGGGAVEDPGQLEPRQSDVVKEPDTRGRIDRLPGKRPRAHELSARCEHLGAEPPPRHLVVQIVARTELLALDAATLCLVEASLAEYCLPQVSCDG